MIKVSVKSYNPNDPDEMINEVTVRGYTKYGISKQDMIVWIEYFQGLGFYWERPVAFAFHGMLEDSAAFEFFMNWLRTKDPEIILKHYLENPDLCDMCIHGHAEICPIRYGDIPRVWDNDKVKQCEMYLIITKWMVGNERETDGYFRVKGGG